MADKPQAREFFVDTNFQKMARRPGGTFRHAAIKRAQAQLDKLKPEFAEWLSQELQGLGAATQLVENNPSDAAAIDDVYRRCCQLRDVGTTMGFELLTFVANNLCEIFESIRNGGDYAKDLIDCHIDSLQLARSDTYKHLSPGQLPELSTGLRRTIEVTSVVPGRTTK